MREIDFDANETKVNLEVENQQPKPVETPTAPPVPAVKKDITYDHKSGDVMVESLSDLIRYADFLQKSGFLPKHYDSTAKVVAGMQLAKELGLPPLNALKQIAVINGSPALWGDLPLAIVRSSGQLEMINEYLLDKDYKVISIENKNLNAEIAAAICEIKRKGSEKKVFNYTAAEAALNPNANDPRNTTWKNYRSIMMKRRVRSIALKDEFPDLLMGASIAEYDHDIIPTAGAYVETERLNKSKQITDRFAY